MIKSSIQAVLVSIATAAAFFAMLVAAAIWAPDDQQAIRRHLIDAVASGEINSQASLGPLQGGTVYRHEFDCLLFNMMLAPANGGPAEAMSNRMVAAEPGTPDTRVPPFPDCQSLLRALPELSGGNARFISYDRYILGMRVLERALLSMTTVERLRPIALAISYALIGVIGLVALGRFRRARGEPIERARAAGYAAIAACLALFYCVHYFDATLYFASMDWVQFIFILASLLWLLADMRPTGLAVYGASYGSLIAIFESMTGGLPLALALQPLLLALGFRGDARAYFDKLVRLWSCFCIAVVASFALKQAYAIVFLGDADNFIVNLLHRTYGDFGAGAEARYSLSYLAMAYYRGSWLVGWGSSRFGAALVIASFLALAIATWRGTGSSLNRPVRWACWLSLFALAAWTAVFLNHAILHAFFMARLLVVPMIAAAVLIVTEAVLRRAKHASPVPA